VSSKGQSLKSSARSSSLPQAKSNRKRELMTMENNRPWIPVGKEKENRQLKLANYYMDYVEENDDDDDVSSRLRKALDMRSGFIQYAFEGPGKHSHTTVLGCFSFLSFLTILRDGHGSNSLGKMDSTMYGTSPEVSGGQLVHSRSPCGQYCTSLSLSYAKKGGIADNLTSSSTPVASPPEVEFIFYSPQAGLQGELIEHVLDDFNQKIQMKRDLITFDMAGVPKKIKLVHMEIDHGKAEILACNGLKLKILFEWYHTIAIIKAAIDKFVQYDIFSTVQGDEMLAKFYAFVYSQTQAASKSNASNLEDFYNVCYSASSATEKNKRSAQSLWKNSIETCILEDHRSICKFGRKNLPASTQCLGPAIENKQKQNKLMLNLITTVPIDVLACKLDEMRASSDARSARHLQVLGIEHDQMEAVLKVAAPKILRGAITSDPTGNTSYFAKKGNKHRPQKYARGLRLYVRVTLSLVTLPLNGC
jgi:hypothetical protein